MMPKPRNPSRSSQKIQQRLFWGLRGGGGNLGIATSMEYRLHDVGFVLAWIIQDFASEKRKGALKD